MASTLTVDEMNRFVRNHFEDFVNKRNAAMIHRNMTPDFYDHDGPGGKAADADADEKMMVAMYQSMPDLRITVEDMIAEGDKVVCRKALDRSGIRKTNAVSWVRAVALRGG